MTEPKKLPPLYVRNIFGVCYGVVGDELTESEALEAIRRCEMHDRLVESLGRLVKMYVINQGGPNEFIACITPPHASALDKRQRRFQETWAAWDEARAILKENQ